MCVSECVKGSIMCPACAYISVSVYQAIIMSSYLCMCVCACVYKYLCWCVLVSITILHNRLNKLDRKPAADNTFRLLK